MDENHKKVLNLGNHTRNMVGQPFYKKKPSNKMILEELLNGLSKYPGTSWAPVSINGGYDLIYCQCPGACGQVWRINIQDKDVANWIVNEINQRNLYLK